MAKSVNRYDRVELAEWLVDTFQETPEGYLTGRACVTNIGVFPYVRKDGGIDFELRHPDDVFDIDSMHSLSMKPMTNNHPSEMVTPENVNKYQVGNVGVVDDWNKDNIHLIAPLVVQGKDAVADVKSGKCELSCGYSADVIDEIGTYLGIPYNKRQTNIRYNHVAIVDRGRAGEDARIKMDAADAEMQDVMIIENMKSLAEKIDSANITEEEMPEMKKITLDGVSFDAEAQVIAAYTKIKERSDSIQVSLDAALKAKSVLEAERDSLKESKDSLSEEVENLKKSQMDEAMMDAKVEAKIKMLSYAKEAKIDTVDKSDAEIKNAVILSQFPKAKLDGRDEIYLDSRFDSACELIDEARGDEATSEVNIAGGLTSGNSENKVDSARQAMMDRVSKQGRGE